MHSKPHPVNRLLNEKNRFERRIRFLTPFSFSLCFQLFELVNMTDIILHGATVKATGKKSLLFVFSRGSKFVVRPSGWNLSSVRKRRISASTDLGPIVKPTTFPLTAAGFASPASSHTVLENAHADCDSASADNGVDKASRKRKREASEASSSLSFHTAVNSLTPLERILATQPTVIKLLELCRKETLDQHRKLLATHIAGLASSGDLTKCVSVTV